MNIREVTTLSIIFAFIIGCSSNEETDIIENNVTENNEVVNQIQDNSLKPNSTGVLTFTPTGVLSDKSINVYYHLPQGDLTNLPILFSSTFPYTKSYHWGSTKQKIAMPI